MLLIALALSAAAQDAAAWTFDVPLELHAHSPVGNVETTVEPWLGLRFGSAGPLAVDGALWLGGYLGQGTAQVSATRWLVAAEARGLMTREIVASALSALSAYGFAGAGAGGGAAHLSAFDDVRIRPLFTWHTRAGAGGELRIQRVVTRVELGAGVRDFRFEISSALAIGVRF